MDDQSRRRHDALRRLENTVLQFGDRLRADERRGLASDAHWQETFRNWKAADHLLRELFDIAGHVGRGDFCPENTEVRCEGCRTPATDPSGPVQGQLIAAEG